jgi:hypothetical protein
MANRIELKSAPEVKRVVCTAFPSYRKLTAFLSPFHPMTVNSYWDGGSRDEYAIVELATMQRKSMPTSTHPYFDVARYGMSDKENEVISVDHVGNITLKILPEGFALVAAGTFCGKPMTANVYVNPANLAKLLPGGAL